MSADRLSTETELRALGGIVATMELVPRSRSANKGSRWRCCCTWNSRAFEAVSRNGASHALCRELVAAGCPDQATQVIDASGKVQFAFRSIHKAAGRTVKENSGSPIQNAVWMPYSDPTSSQKQGISPEDEKTDIAEEMPPVSPVPQVKAA